MITSPDSNDKLVTIDTVEGQVIYLMTMLSYVYGSVTAVEGLDEAANPVKVSVTQCDLVPVVLFNGTRSYRKIMRLSVPMSDTANFRAAQWNAIDVNGLGAEEPPIEIVAIENNT